MREKKESEIENPKRKHTSTISLLIMIITNGMHNESSQRFNHFYRISER